MESRKIMLACFIGGCICTLIALLVAPAFWWLGILAGFIIGYFAYDLKEIYYAIPKAWRATKKSIGSLGKYVKSNPVYLLAIVCGFIFGLLTFIFLDATTDVKVPIGSNVFLSFLTSLLASIFSCLSITGFASLGANSDEIEINTPETLNNYSYGIIISWVGRGLLILVKLLAIFLFWKMWKWIAIGIAYAIWYSIKFSGIFLYKLFYLIHSYKRLLCAVDGSLGGVLTYWLMRAKHLTVQEFILVVVCGGIMGAGIGLLNWELVSKRLLKVQAR